MQKKFIAVSHWSILDVQEFLNALSKTRSGVQLVGFSVNILNGKLYYSVIAEYLVS